MTVRPHTDRLGRPVANQYVATWRLPALPSDRIVVKFKRKLTPAEIKAISSGVLTF